MKFWIKYRMENDSTVSASHFGNCSGIRKKTYIKSQKNKRSRQLNVVLDARTSNSFTCGREARAASIITVCRNNMEAANGLGRFRPRPSAKRIARRGFNAHSPDPPARKSQNKR